MPRNYFTKEQILELEKNEYVLKVTAANITFTMDFKKIFVSLLTDGYGPTEAIRRLGINPNILGRHRIEGLSERLKRQAIRPEGFNRKTGPGIGRPKKITFNSIEEENQYLKDQLEFLKQENEFLKKLEALERKYPKSQRKKNSK